ncbi:MAG: OsmC family protein [Haloechinothrix sp.]
MATREHHYSVGVRWTGNTGSGTSTYSGYSREHEIEIPGKPTIIGTADPAFRGTDDLHTPEDLLVAALSQCHMLSYLALAAMSRINVVSYVDAATGTMVEDRSQGTAQFTEVTLHPTVTIAEAALIDEAAALHVRANQLCFIARSVNFPVQHAAITLVRE